MCGLVAIFAYRAGAAPVDRAELLALCDAMAARGPDGAGAWIAPDGCVGLGHRRLAILDLDPRADQPMVSACGRFRIVFNGEIYNFRALRRSLEAAGARLRTTSDTEVILELWARRGPACLAELRGMYAFALWDAEAGALFLARDPFGIKPLYLADDGRTVRAASQVKALLAGGAVAREPDPAGLAGFWLTGSVPEPFTLHRAIRAVPAGHLVRVDAAGVHAPEPFAPLEGLLAEAEDGEPADPRAAFLDSVRHHLVADVPVAVFLSAGIDSGAILAALHALDPELARRTTAVTVTFPEFRGRADDEAPAAAELARRFGVRHRIVEVEEAEFRADLDGILAAMDQPSIDGVNSWIVAEATARAGFKVALSGTGGDELLAGYPSFRDVPRWYALARLPGAVPGLPRLARLLVERLAPGLSARLPKLPGALELARTFAGAWLLRRGLFLPHELPALMGRELAREGLERLAWHASAETLLHRGPRQPIARVALLEAAFYLRNQLLRDIDWASMAHSLEVRVPFVDPPLWRALLPATVRTPGKAGFARALALPEAWLARPKTGFSTPVGTWTARALGIDPQRPWARLWAKEVLRGWGIGAASDPVTNAVRRPAMAD